MAKSLRSYAMTARYNASQMASLGVRDDSFSGCDIFSWRMGNLRYQYWDYAFLEFIASYIMQTFSWQCAVCERLGGLNGDNNKSAKVRRRGNHWKQTSVLKSRIRSRRRECEAVVTGILKKWWRVLIWVYGALHPLWATTNPPSKRIVSALFQLQQFFALLLLGLHDYSRTHPSWSIFKNCNVSIYEKRYAEIMPSELL